MEDDRRISGISDVFDGLAALRCMRVFYFLMREFSADQYIITSLSDEVEELSQYVIFHTVMLKSSGTVALQIGVYRNGTYFITNSTDDVASKLRKLLDETPGMMVDAP